MIDHRTNNSSIWKNIKKLQRTIVNNKQPRQSVEKRRTMEMNEIKKILSNAVEPKNRTRGSDPVGNPVRNDVQEEIIETNEIMNALANTKKNISTR